MFRGDTGGFAGLFVCMFSIGLFLIFSIVGIYLVSSNSKIVLSEYPSIPATFFEMSECKNKTTWGFFELDPHLNSKYGLKKEKINATFDSCLCDDDCNYWSPPTCCRKFINKTDYFILDISLPDYHLINVNVNYDKSTGTYFKDFSTDLLWGWNLIVGAIIILLCWISSVCSMYYKDYKRIKQYETIA